MNGDVIARKAGEFIADLGDSALTVATGSELLEKVPFVSHIAKAFGFKEAYHQYRLARNCKAFLDAAKEGDLSTMGDRLRKVVDDPEKLWELEDTMLEVLIEAEKPLKAEILGRLMRFLADGAISYQQFDITSLLLLNGSVPALKAIERFFDLSGGECFVHADDLQGTEPLLISLGVASRHGTKFEVSQFGQLLHNFGFLRRE